ncbi:efflux transporter outer membrane subunit [Sphingomonas sp. ID1715]|uniref:efflux transporter outer membrane subunit n=1 Tax=Sphingomonas sp. ID1715 TaxID=1656898 RepID=UPI0014888BAD|nr:efflux transporter outer membrane subunit [Sphingomonas sp. ID1715]NNM75747.1 efflux transporter outer membrane subunit [Sphingomonas sp. ID1715]
MVADLRSFKHLFAGGVVLGLSACAGVPELGPKPLLQSAGQLGAKSLRGSAAAWPISAWWRGYGDPQLNALVEEALTGSPDVAIAAARLRAAEAAAQQAGAALVPSLELDASVAAAKQSYNNGPPRQFVPQGIQDIGRVAGTLSFDLDLWGRNRAALAAATSEAEAARVDAEQSALLLSTAIASAYADLAGLYASRDVAAEAVRVRGDTAELTARRVANGLDTRGEQLQAESRVPAARAELAALDEAIALTRNRLAALVGKGPDRGATIARPAISVPGTALPQRLDLDLLGRRPDLVAARLRSEAAASRIKVARAAFYPNINLSALVGLQAIGLGNLFESGSSFGSAGPALSLPLFDGGRREGGYRGARAQYDEAVARYNGTLVAALREVADATASLKALDVRLVEQRSALAAAEAAARIARIRYQGGLANQLTALQADDTVLGFRRAVAELEARRFALDVALVRALGGGFRYQSELAGLR